MDRTTKSTAGPNCDICKRGGPGPTPAPPVPVPTPGPPPSPPPPGAKSCGYDSVAGAVAGTTQKGYCGTWFDIKSGVGGDKFDWTRHSGHTGSSGTGPKSAADGKHYLYIETSCPRSNGQKAILSTVPVTVQAGAFLRFKYSMYGKTIGKLNIKVDEETPYDYQAKAIIVWEVSGDQGTPDWKDGYVDLQKYAGKKVAIAFEGIRGTQYTGDIAIDAVTLYLGGSAPAPATTAAPAPATTPAPTPATTSAPAPASTPAPGPATTSAPGPAPNPAPGLKGNLDVNKLNTIERLLKEMLAALKGWAR